MKKVLTATESAGDFKEVTASEMNTIKAKDEKWTPPSEELIATATAAGAVYNHKTGFFELNGLTDLTETEMREICTLSAGKLVNIYAAGAFTCMGTIRTHMPILQTPQINAESLFACCYKIKIIAFSSYYGPDSPTSVTNLDNAFRYCYALQKIDGVIKLLSNKVNGAFQSCSALESVMITDLQSNIRFAESPKLTPESIQYMVHNAANTAPITITLHPTAYARLTDELIAQAATKKITFATT